MMTSKRFFSVTIRAGLINRGLSQICDTTPSFLPTLHLQGFHTGRLKESTQLVFLRTALYPLCSMFCKYSSHAPSHPHAKLRHIPCHAHPAQEKPVLRQCWVFQEGLAQQPSQTKHRFPHLQQINQRAALCVCNSYLGISQRITEILEESPLLSI